MLQIGSQISQKELTALGAVSGHIDHLAGYAYVVLEYSDGSRKQLTMQQFDDAKNTAELDRR